MAKKTKVRKPPRAAAPKLTPAQRSQDANPLYDPSRVLSGHDLLAASRSVVNEQFGPKLAEADRQVANARTQGTALSDRAKLYFSQLAGNDQTLAGQQGASADAMRANLQAIGNTATATRDAASQDVMSRVAAQQAQGIPAGGGDTQVLDELAALRARGAGTSQAFQSAGELQAGRAAALQAQEAAATQQHGGEIQGNILTRVANQMAELGAQKQDLQSQRSDAYAKQLGDMRQQGFENLVTTRGLGIRQDQLAADVANQQTQAALAAQRIASTDRHNLATERTQRSGTRQQAAVLGERQRHDKVIEGLQGLSVDIAQQRANATTGAGGKGSKESQSAINIKRGIQNTLNLLANGTHSERYLTNKVGVPPDVMQAAQDLKNFGHLQYDTIAALTRLGVKIPKVWQPAAVDRSAPH